MQLNAADRQRLIEDDPDLLYAFLRSAPSWAILRAENRLDREVGFFRCHFDRGNLLEIKPTLSSLRPSTHPTLTHYSLPHASIVVEVRFQGRKLREKRVPTEDVLVRECSFWSKENSAGERSSAVGNLRSRFSYSGGDGPTLCRVEFSVYAQGR
jgi:hypothetical protein